MRFENKELIIFDFDGTLIDSAPDLNDSINYMLEKLGKDKFTQDIIRTWVGNGASTLIKRALSGAVLVDDSKFDDETFEKASKYFFEYYSKNCANKTTLYENVETTLNKLYKKGFTLAIATNKPDEYIKPILDKFNLTKYFKIYIGANSVEKKKPDSMMLLKICGNLNIKVENSIMVGDSKNDVLAARNCQMDSIALTYGYNYDEDISIYNPNIVFDNFEEINKVL